MPTHGIVIGITPNAFSIFDVQVFNTAGLGPKSDSYPCKTASDGKNRLSKILEEKFIIIHWRPLFW